ncbi:MAG: PDZ domain-containing protein [Gemmataceae bacterium]
MTNHSPRASHPFWAVLLLATLCSAGEAAASQDVDDLQEQAIREAVRVVSPAVVRIETSGGTEVVGAVRGPRSGVRRGQGPTSGVIVSPDGYVISSAFNFANKPATIRVALPGSKERKVARVVANDQSRMLTLLKIADLTPGTKLPVATVAPRGEIQIGQTAIAVGRTLSQEADGPANVSVGIVSALDRIWGRALQTDAKISPTNYGGPLVDLQGRVMGILVPASPQAEGETAGFEWYDSGIGFAVPLEDVLQALPRMVKGSEKEPVVLKRGFLGITMRSQDMFEAQPIIGTVMPGSAAEKAGMKPGDLVTQIDGKPVRNHAQVMHRLGGKYEGDAVAIQVEREKKPVDFARVILGSPESAYPQVFLGILPMRDDPTPGVEVRHVFEKSPAELAKIQVGDRIQKVQVPGAPPNAPMAPLTRGRDQLMGLLEMLRPGQELKLELKRKDTGKEETVTVKLAEAPDQVPARLPETRSAKKALVKPAEKPAAKSKDGDKPAEKPDPAKEAPAKEAPAKAPPAKDKVEKVETGFQKKTTAAADSTYWVYIPETYDPNISCAMVSGCIPWARTRKRTSRISPCPGPTTATRTTSSWFVRSRRTRAAGLPAKRTPSWKLFAPSSPTTPSTRDGWWPMAWVWVVRWPTTWASRFEPSFAAWRPSEPTAAATQEKRCPTSRWLSSSRWVRRIRSSQACSRHAPGCRASSTRSSNARSRTWAMNISMARWACRPWRN